MPFITIFIFIFFSLNIWWLKLEHKENDLIEIPNQRNGPLY